MVEQSNHISAEEPDWSREHKAFWEWNPGKSLVLSIRRYQRASEKNGLIASLVKRVAVMQHRFWSVASGADIPINCQLGGGLLLPHPNGIVIHPDVKIGPNCLIFQQVTLGSTAKSPPPILGGHVDVGAGAKVLGRVTLGNHSQVGANAVVMIDVPENKVAVGVPAKII